MLHRGRIDYRRHVSHVGANQFITGIEANNERLDGREPPFLPDDVYAQALDAIVPACADLVLICPDGRVLLGRRQQEPQPDWWVIGGRMRVRETFYQAGNRNALRELGIELDPANFDDTPLGAFSLMWDTRAQAPAEDGCHTLSLPFIYRVTAKELRTITPNKEYGEMRPFEVDDVVHGSSDYHPALRAIVLAAKRRLQA